ncbi:MAG: sodium:calcium antiporter [Candidatus Anstonellales archaeon]
MVFFEMLTLIFFLAVLSKSASIVVENLAKLSKFFGISQIAIGFILLAISTTLPELSVSIVSSSAGEGAIAAGNAFGSTITNILLIFGVGGFLYGVKIGKEELKDIATVLVLTTVISSYIIFSSSVSGKALAFLEGVILLLLFGAYMIYIFTKEKSTRDEENSVTKKEALRAFLFFCVAIILVFFSAGFVVESAVKIARLLHITESFIGATIIAVGTSLPEISICLQAIRKKHYGIALGDAIGANMSNLTLVLGAASLINPISVVLPVFIAALLFAIVANMLLFYVAAVNKRLEKLGGAMFLFVYVIYIITIFYLQIGELSQA